MNTDLLGFLVSVGFAGVVLVVLASDELVKRLDAMVNRAAADAVRRATPRPVDLEFEPVEIPVEVFERVACAECYWGGRPCAEHAEVSR